MFQKAKILGAIWGATLLALLLVNVASADSTVRFQLTNNNQALKSARVVLYLSYGTETGASDANGNVSIPVAKGRGMWIEINGYRLNRLYEVGTVPSMIDVAQVGYMTWHGGR